jgi:hypothetical protein
VGLAFNEIVGQSDAPELERQLERYRVNLLQLGWELAAMQASALLCRQELVARTRHLRGTQAWLSASQETY